MYVDENTYRGVSEIMKFHNPTVDKVPRRVCARRRKENEIIFGGGLYVDENT